MGNDVRLIDANALFKSLVRDLVMCCRCEEYTKWNMAQLVLNRLDDAPTIDAVPVVRCKDCKHNVTNREHDAFDNTDYTDIVCDYWMSDGILPDDFCSYGERKDDATD